MSRFVDDGAGFKFIGKVGETNFIGTTPRVTIENQIAKLTKQLWPDAGVEFLTGALSSVCSEEQLKAFVMHLEESVAKK